VVWEQLIANFEAGHPGVKVVREVGPHSSTEFHDLVTQKLRNRDAEMDVFFMDVIWPAEFGAAGWALPLDAFFPAAERQSFLEAPIQADSYNGRIYGVPMFVDAGMLYYRKDLLDKYDLRPPRTWPELVAAAFLAQERDPYLTGYSAQFKQYEGLVCNMMEFIMSNGATLWSEQTLQSTLNDAKAKEAVRFVRDQIIGAISHRGVLAYQARIAGAVHRERRSSTAIGPTRGVANDPSARRVAGKVGSCRCRLSRKERRHLGRMATRHQPLLAQTPIGGNSSEHMTSGENTKRIALDRTGTPRKRYQDPEI
jgi:multiple sugar transport system substrate-binding protein